MRTARSSNRLGVSTNHSPEAGTHPGTRHPPPPPTSHTPPSVNRITDTCKNITFQQLRLPMVKNYLSKKFFYFSIYHVNLL